MQTSLSTILCNPHTVAGHRQACAWFAVMMMIAAFVYSPAEAAPIAVRFPEGVTHGFLLVRSLEGKIIAQGEMTQVAKAGDLVESHLVFKFKDGTLHEEKVVFSQQSVFTLISYRLSQHGPSFPDQIDVSIDRGSGEYMVRSATGEEGKEEVLTGVFDLPKDVYNGMMITVLLNLPQGAGETVSFLAFTPKPEVLNLALLPREEYSVKIGEVSRKALHYVFEPDIGMIRELLGKATGRLPAEFHYNCWILVDEVPSFVHYEGPLQLMGPIVRIELVSPVLRKEPENKKISFK